MAGSAERQTAGTEAARPAGSPPYGAVCHPMFGTTVDGVASGITGRAQDGRGGAGSFV